MNKLFDYVNNNMDIDDVFYQIFGKSIPSGKMFCPCPTHNNVNTPAAKKYGNAIHCFSCNKTYTPYHLLKWYRPTQLDEIKSTVIFKSSPIKLTKGIHVKPIDRNQSIDDILSFILKDI